MTGNCHAGFGGEGAWFTCPSNWERQRTLTCIQIERLMGEIAKRCRHRWAHWSDEGLKNILTLILVHYTNPTLYEEYWQNYIHQDSIKTTLLTTQI